MRVNAVIEMTEKVCVAQMMKVLIAVMIFSLTLIQLLCIPSVQLLTHSVEMTYSNLTLTTLHYIKEIFKVILKTFAFPLSS